MMLKLLFLKKLYDLSDETLISNAQTNMAYKFFLDLEPEAKMFDLIPSHKVQKDPCYRRYPERDAERRYSRL